ncbi:YkuS family protein [Alkalihalobacillus deserti]|uniref:YkuS family protein n=1 Tax=Alkalihalobacillus deserti TaxID=2879466 RepID=UPI001D13E863|nr:YkuS family protein [Alkalihalobacillus deserti]
MPRIGVEQSLSDVQQELQSKGYEVVQLKQEQDAQGCDCCVITGQDQNVMGVQDAAIRGSVINAHGMTAEEICKQVEQKVGQ